MEKIRKLRGEIDKIDLKTLRLLEERVAIAKRIGRLKRETGVSYHDPCRERNVLENISRNTMLKKTFVRRIFKNIVEYCRNGESE